MVYSDLSILVVLAIITLAGVISVVSVKFLGNDNPIEKIGEQVIKEETGVDLNFDKNPIPAVNSSQSSSAPISTSSSPTSSS